MEVKLAVDGFLSHFPHGEGHGLILSSKVFTVFMALVRPIRVPHS